MAYPRVKLNNVLLPKHLSPSRKNFPAFICPSANVVHSFQDNTVEKKIQPIFLNGVFWYNLINETIFNRKNLC